MKATFVELRKKSSEIVRALDRNETVTIYYRGRAKAIMKPIGSDRKHVVDTAMHPAFGLWRELDETEDVSAQVRRLRKRRFDDL